MPTTPSDLDSKPPPGDRLGPFAIRIDFAEPTVVCSVGGDLDALTVPMLRSILATLEHEGYTRIAVDLASVSFLGAGALGLFAGTAARLRQADGDLALRSPREHVRRMLDMTGIGVRLVVDEPSTLLSLQDDLVRSAWRPTLDDLVDDKLRKVVTIAAQAIEGADGVSVSLARHGSVRTVAASNDVVMRMDDHQYETGEGPCLSAAADGKQVDVEQLAQDLRWPDFVPLALTEGIASILSTPLIGVAGGSIGALNIYSSTTRAFGHHQRELAMVFATHASEIAGAPDPGIAEEELDARIADALRSRAVLGLAQGILMARSHISADEASAVLHRTARDAGTSTLVQAAGLVASTAPPGAIRD